MTDYPLARSMPADPSNYAESDRRSVRRVVIHITDGHEQADPVAQMWQQPHHESSAHYVIGQSGAIIQAVRHKDVAWHAHAANADSIGIEHCARSPHDVGWPAHDPGLPVSETQYQASARLVAWICDLHGIPKDREHILGHSEADPKTDHVDCPNRIWDWEKYMKLVADASAGSDAVG